jgi:hypothetical protein
MARIEHDPNDYVDYSFDFAAPDWLGRTWLGADTIATATVTTTSTVTISGVVHDTTRVTYWATGGTPYQAAPMLCHITTTAGRQADRTMWLNVISR